MRPELFPMRQVECSGPPGVDAATRCHLPETALKRLKAALPFGKFVDVLTGAR
jgi:hypothetical protein